MDGQGGIRYTSMRKSTPTMSKPFMPIPKETSNAPVLSCTGLLKRYEDLIAVDGVDLSVAKGECFGLLGPNGAGKTTTVEMLEGLTVPDGGTVELLGKHWSRKSSRTLRERIGVQLQDNQMAEKLTVREVLTLFRSFYESGMEVDTALDLFELRQKQHTRYHKLSGGQKQRLSLATALINNPDILFLDEPTTGLDPQARVRVWDMVNRFKAGGGTVIITTHYMEEAEKLCDRLAIMDHGKIIVEGSPGALIAGLEADQVVQLTLNAPIVNGLLENLPGVTSVTEREGGYALHVRTIAETLPALITAAEAAALSIQTLSTHQASLDDVFLAHTGRALRDA
jgi:ABC-2 type transport system ATP-binding protein